MRVGVKFCGNCNPRINMPELAGTLAAAAAEARFVRWDDQSGYDILLVLNSCQVGCATRPPFKGPCVFVTSESVDRWPVYEHQLVATVLHALNNLGVYLK